MKTITNRIIRKFNPCYDPAEVVKDENEELTVVEWVQKYRNLVKEKQDVIWLLCNKHFMSDRDLRLFAVWCAREALKLIENPDERSVNACNVAEKFANGEATDEELSAAWAAAEAAWAAARDAARAAAEAAWATRAATGDATGAAAWAAAWAAAEAAWATGDAARAAARAAAEAAWAAARAAAWAAAGDAAGDAQIDKLLTYFEKCIKDKVSEIQKL